LEISGKKVLVTGGAGFIGSHLVDYLLRLGSDVTVLDNFDDFYRGKEGNISPHASNRRFHLVRGSILDVDLLSKTMNGSALVFHLAAQAGVRYSLDNPLKTHEVNATGTLNVLEACRKTKVSKLVYASSSSVYGDVVKVPISENHPVNPTNPYGVSKLAGEKYCLSYFVSYGLPVACLRYFSVYGPRGRPDQVLYSMASRAAQGLPPEIFGSGDQSRDFTFVSDIVSGTIMAALRDDSAGHIFNLGYGEEFSISEAAEKIIEFFGLHVKPHHRAAYRGDFPRTLCDNRYARTHLGWNPQVGFESGLSQFLEWFVSSRVPEVSQARVRSRA
jgi:UDP-glucose 4-epimerase